MVYTSSNAMSKSIQDMSKQSKTNHQQKQQEHSNRDTNIASKKHSKHSKCISNQQLHSSSEDQAMPMTRCRQPQMVKKSEQPMHKHSERFTSMPSHRQNDRHFYSDNVRQLSSTATNVDCKNKNPVDKDNGYDFDADDRHAVDRQLNQRSIHNHSQNVSAECYYADDEFSEVIYI